jgi:hypothetical protein
MFGINTSNLLYLIYINYINNCQQWLAESVKAGHCYCPHQGSSLSSNMFSTFLHACAPHESGWSQVQLLSDLGGIGTTHSRLLR